jgi:hypothetical protein
VIAGLVPRGREWPGLWSEPKRIGAGPRVVKRPALFFRADAHMPEEVELLLVPPPGFASAEAFRGAVERALGALEERAHQRLAAEGRRFIGRLRVLAQDTSRRPKAEGPRRGISPKVAARNPALRIELLAQLAAFVAEYRRALRARRDGLDAVFPAGTYLLRIAHGVACAPAW